MNSSSHEKLSSRYLNNPLQLQFDVRDNGRTFALTHTSSPDEELVLASTYPADRTNPCITVSETVACIADRGDIREKLGIKVDAPQNVGRCLLVRHMFYLIKRWHQEVRTANVCECVCVCVCVKEERGLKRGHRQAKPKTPSHYPLPYTSTLLLVFYTPDVHRFR